VEGQPAVHWQRIKGFVQDRDSMGGLARDDAEALVEALSRPCEISLTQNGFASQS
jgi:hypothetical protein